MGLDMFLNKYPKVEGVELWKLDYDTVKKNDPELSARLEPYEKIHGDTSRFQAYLEYYDTVGYWRKANQIHRWFVENVQNGNDDCGRYLVDKTYCIELLATIRVLLSEERTAERASKILPTRDGFFFGGEAYDEYYWQMVEETERILTRVLNETDWDKECITYQSSW